MQPTITLQLTQQEANVLMGAIDTALRSRGYELAEFAVSMGYKIQNAIKEAAQAPAHTN